MQLTQSEEFVKLFNLIVRAAKPINPTYDLAKSLDDKFVDIEIDSLDSLLILVYVCELFAIDEELGKSFSPATIGELRDLVIQHKTREPESIEQAIKEVL
jgi:acyl carrier protein